MQQLTLRQRLLVARALAARSPTSFLTAPDISAESVVQTLADHAAQSGRI